MAPIRCTDDDTASSTDDNSKAVCSYCIGMSVYTKAMWKQRQTPECKGIQVNFSTSRKRLQELKDRAAHPRKKNFTFMGVGLSVYSPEWMDEGKHLPYVKGISVIAIQMDDNERMKEIEKRKRLKRELQKNTGNQGDLQDGNDTRDDGEEMGNTEEDDVDGEATDEGHALVESEVVRGLKTPRGPAVVPASITMAELRKRAVEKAKYSVNAMYKFWERRLDGFGDRYVDSCRRLTEQMEKQAKITPHNVMWLVHRIEEYVVGRGGGEK